MIVLMDEYSQEEIDRVVAAMNSFGITDPKESNRVIEVMRKRSKWERIKNWIRNRKNK
jgi:hypothetical protein